MEDWSRIPFAGEERHPTTNMPQPWLLTVVLVLLAAYRMWVIPRLGATLYVDEAQYWTWAQSLDWGYYSKPPLIAWLIRLCTTLFGNGLVAVKLPALILYPATAWVLFLLGKTLFDVRIGFRAGLAFALIPLVSLLGLGVSTDAPLLFCWTAAMLYLARAIGSDRMTDWLMLGVTVGMGIMAKYTMAAFAVSALLYLLPDAKRRRILTHPGLWIAIVVATLIVLPNIVWNWAHDFPTLHHTADITHVEGGNNKHGNAGEFILAQIGSLGPIFALAFLAGLKLAFHRLRDRRYQFLLCFSLPLLALVLVQSLRSEANGNWAAPGLVTALVLATVWLSQRRRSHWWWAAALSFNALIMIAAYHHADFFRLAGIQQTARLDPVKRMKGWDVLAQQIRPLLVSHHDAVLLTTDRTMMAHLLYQLRDFNPDHLAWAPNQRPADHYQLTTPLTEAASSRPLLLVTQDEKCQDVLDRFSRHEVLAIIEVNVEPGLVRKAWVILLEGFNGYAHTKPQATPATP